jgi:hypothetical protein
MVKKLHHKNTQQYKKPTLRKQKLVLNQFSYTTFFDEEEALVLNYLASSGAPSCCVLPETCIRMYDSTDKQVQDIRVGDTVLSYNLLTGVFEKGVVKNLLSRINTFGFYLINNKLKATPEHPLWVKGKEWTGVKYITQGDIIIDSKGREVTVTDIQRVEKPVAVYNISVDSETKTYFIDGYLTVTYTDIRLLPYMVRSAKKIHSSRSSVIFA